MNRLGLKQGRALGLLFPARLAWYTRPGSGKSFIRRATSDSQRSESFLQRNGAFLVFGGLFGGIIGALVKSWLDNSNFAKVRDLLEESALLDGRELMDLASNNFSPAQLDQVTHIEKNNISYAQFVAHTKRHLESFKAGYCFDRLIARRPAPQDQDRENSALFFMISLLTALETETLEDRARILFRVCQNLGYVADGRVDKDVVARVLEFLHFSCQLPASKFVVKSHPPSDLARFWPIQQYKWVNRSF